MSRLLKFPGIGVTLLAAAVVLAACASNTEPVDGSTSTTTTDAATEVSVVEGEPYRQPDGGDPSTVDIYMPDMPPGRSAVVLLHGWGPDWDEGPDLDLAPLAEEIARLGSTVFYFGWDTNGGLSADSAADLSCIGGFVSARAAEYGADADTVVGHSMGGESGSMLALSSFGLAPGADCVETGETPTPYALLGMAGSYGVNAQPLDAELTRFAVRKQPADPIREIAATEFVTPGLTAVQAYGLSGYRTLPSSNPLRVVLLVGSRDQYPVTNESVTAAFADALAQHGTDVEVIVVPDANHNTVIYPRQ